MTAIHAITSIWCDLSEPSRPTAKARRTFVFYRIIWTAARRKSG